MYPVRKDMPFYASLLMLKIFGYYPSGNHDEHFLCCAYLLTAIWSTNIVNFGICFAVSASNNSDEVSEDLGNLIGFSSCMFITVRFATCYKKWSELFVSLATYQKFGKPPRYHLVKKYGDILTTACSSYVFLAALSAYFVIVATEDWCEKKYDGERMCGLLFPIVLPSQREIPLVVKRLLLAFQIISSINFAHFLYVILLVRQGVELICARVDHMSDIFTNVCLATNIDTQNERLKFWIEYHQETLRLCRELNYLSKHTIGYMFLTATATLACFSFQVLKHSNPTPLFVILAYYPIIYVICHSGQRLQDKMMSIGDSAYLSQWEMLNLRIQKSIPIIIARSQYKVGLDVLPLGKADYILFVMILKTTYSYLTLLYNIEE